MLVNWIGKTAEGFLCMRAHARVCVYVCVYTCVCTSVYVCVCVHVYVCVRVYVSPVGYLLILPQEDLSALTHSA